MKSVHNDIKYGVSNHLWSPVRDQTRYDTWSKIEDNVWLKVRIATDDQLWDIIYDEVWERTMFISYKD